jgi:hypothetical protein
MAQNNRPPNLDPLSAQIFDKLDRIETKLARVGTTLAGIGANLVSFENDTISSQNAARLAANLSASLLPLRDLQTGNTIPGCPTTFAEIGSLSGAEAARILQALQVPVPASLAAKRDEVRRQFFSPAADNGPGEPQAPSITLPIRPHRRS